MTKSIVKAKDYDVKIKFKGEEHYIELGDIKVGDKTLKEWFAEHESLLKRFNANEKLYGKELRAINNAIADLTAFKNEAYKDIKNIEKVVEKAIINKLKVGY